MANGFCRPFWKLGSGHYGKTLGQNSKDAIGLCQDLVLSFVDKLSVEKASSFTLADYGTTDGYASMHLFERIIRQVKEKGGEDFPVQVVYEDQPGNDFNSLFMWLAGETSYLSKFRQVYPMVTDISYFNQCVPDSTCDIIFTSMTTHWLDSLDGITYKDGVFYPSNLKDHSDPVCQIAQRDWTKFLGHRARELKSGGLLVAIGIRALAQSDLPVPPKKDLPDLNIEKLLEAVWKTLRDEGAITQKEFEGCLIPRYWRTLEETVSPLEKDPSLAGEGGLALVHYDEVVHQFWPKQLWLKKLDKEGVDDRAFFAHMMASTHRTWSDGAFRKSLSSMRTEKQDAILDRMYKHFEDRLLGMNPDDFNAYYAISRLVLQKR